MTAADQQGKAGDCCDQASPKPLRKLGDKCKRCGREVVDVERGHVLPSGEVVDVPILKVPRVQT